MTLQTISAKLNGSPIPFTNGDTFSFYPSHTLNFTLTCQPSHPGTIGWYPDLAAPGYCLPGELFPSNSLSIMDATGCPIPGFMERFSPQACLVLDDLGGKLEIKSEAILNRLTLSAVPGGTFTITGQLPLSPVWVKLRIVLSNGQSHELPLWPIGCPMFLIEETPSIASGSYEDPGMTTEIGFLPYLSDRAPSHTASFNSGLVPYLSRLAMGLDPVSFFKQPSLQRERYNAVVLRQDSHIRSFLKPKIDASRLSFSSLRGFTSLINPGFPLSLDLVTSAPIMKLSDNSIVNAYNSEIIEFENKNSSGEVASSTYGWATTLPVALISSGPSISNRIFTNYHISGSTLNAFTKVCELSLTAVDSLGAMDKDYLVTLGDLQNPKRGDLALVACHAWDSSYGWILDPEQNPSHAFFYHPDVSQGVGSLTTSATLQVIQTDLPSLPVWGEEPPEIPVDMVVYNGATWVPFVRLFGLPVTVTTSAIHVTNTSSEVTSMHEPQDASLAGSMFPLVITGTPIATPLPY